MQTPPLALEDMQNKILQRRRALEASLFTLDYKIENLKPFFSHLQVSTWIADREEISRQLGILPTDAQVKAWAKATTRLIKDSRKTILKNQF
jgi:hypothetical protein